MNEPSSVICRPSSEEAQRAAVVAEARSWIGTPYHNCADIKGVGVDCGMLLVRVFVDTGLIAPFDPRPYPIDWHLHRDDERYLGFIFDRGSEVAAPLPGDVMVVRYGRSYSHGGIVTAVGAGLVPALIGRPQGAPLRGLRVVHAYQPARMVLEEEVAHNAAFTAPMRRPRFFSYWNSRHPRATGSGPNGSGPKWPARWQASWPARL